MSVLEKVARERQGISSSPHVAHHADWSEDMFVKPESTEQVQAGWAKGLEAAAQGPRYAKRNMNLDGSAQAGGTRYSGTADPARPKTPPFAWGDDSGTVKTQELQRAPPDTKENWAKNIADAQSGPYFAKPHMMARSDDPTATGLTRSKHDVERSRNIFAHDDAPPATARGGAKGANTSGDWAHTRGPPKAAPYLASDPQWQDSAPMTSESRHMGRNTEMTAAESAKFTEDAQPAFRFAKSHGDFHLKKDIPSPNPSVAERRAGQSSFLDRMSTPKSARGEAKASPAQRASAKSAAPAPALADAGDSDVYSQWKSHTPSKTEPAAHAAPEAPIREASSPVRPEAQPPVASQPVSAPAPATAVDASSDAGSTESFARVGGRGGPKQSHAGANVFASSWGFGAEHGDKDVSASDRFTSANRQMMGNHTSNPNHNLFSRDVSERLLVRTASGHSGGAATAAPTRGRGGARQAWGESAAEPVAKQSPRKHKPPVDDGRPWGVSANQEAMQGGHGSSVRFPTETSRRTLLLLEHF